jgi:hypothetical protein
MTDIPTPRPAPDESPRIPAPRPAGTCGRALSTGEPCPDHPRTVDDLLDQAAAVVDAEPTRGVLAEVAAERTRQDEKWGEQNHPDGPPRRLAPLIRDSARHNCQAAAAEGRLTWQHILREEVAEAHAETDPARIRAELVQVAAVAVAQIEAIDRRAGGDAK